MIDTTWSSKESNEGSDIKTFRSDNSYKHKKKYVKPQRYLGVGHYKILLEFFDKLAQELVFSLRRRCGILEIKEDMLYFNIKNNYIFVFPDEGYNFNVLVVHVSRRKWYISKYKAMEHLRGVKKAMGKIYRILKRKIHPSCTFNIITICLVGNYTNNVIKGKAFYDLKCSLFGGMEHGLGYVKGRLRRGLFVYRPEFGSWFKKVLRNIYKLYTKLITNILRTFERKGISPFGNVKDDLRMRACVVISCYEVLKKLGDAPPPPPNEIVDICEEW